MNFEKFESDHREWINEHVKDFKRYPDCAQNAAWAYEWCSKRMVPQKQHQQAWAAFTKWIQENGQGNVDDHLRTLVNKKLQKENDELKNRIEIYEKEIHRKNNPPLVADENGNMKCIYCWNAKDD